MPSEPHASASTATTPRAAKGKRTAYVLGDWLGTALGECKAKASHCLCPDTANTKRMPRPPNYGLGKGTANTWRGAGRILGEDHGGAWPLFDHPSKRVGVTVSTQVP